MYNNSQATTSIIGKQNNWEIDNNFVLHGKRSNIPLYYFLIL